MVEKDGKQEIEKEIPPSIIIQQKYKFEQLYIVKIPL